MITTTHKFIDNTDYRVSDNYMIIGTIHPHKTDEFQLQYFYGNKSSLWILLHNAFPNIKFDTVENIKKALKDNHVFITDIIKQCKRKNEKVTKDAELEIIQNNKEQIREAIKNSKINTIFFTSAFGKNNATQLFVNIFKIKKKLLNYDEYKKEFVIPKEIFGREIKGIILFSPSGDARRGIGKSKLYKEYSNKHKSEKPTVTKFIIDFYKDKFKTVFVYD